MQDSFTAGASLDHEHPPSVVQGRHSPDCSAKRELRPGFFPLLFFFSSTLGPARPTPQQDKALLPPLLVVTKRRDGSKG